MKVHRFGQLLKAELLICVIYTIVKQKIPRRKIMNQQIKNALASYGRSVLGAATAMYASGITDPQTLVYSLLGALVPVVMRAANPADPAFGKMPSVDEVDKAVKSAKVVKKAAKKAPAKKSTSKGGGGGTSHKVL
jgi:hypothetical protein